MAMLATPVSVQAVDYAISGHVNRMIRYADDGEGSDIQSLDNATTQSRLRWVGSEDIGNGLKAGILIETGIASDNSDSVPLYAGDSPAFDSDFTIRHSALHFSGKEWGKVTMGHTSEVSDGAAQVDLSGDTLVNYSESAQDLGGAIAWRTGDGGRITGGSGCATGDCTIISAREDFDGGRTDVLRYDSPSLGPVTVGVAMWNDDSYDVGATLDTSLGGGHLKVRGAWAKSENTFGYNQWSSSGSYLFSQGTSVTVSLGGRDEQDPGVTDPFNFYLKLGHKWGSNVVTIGGGQTQDLLTDGADGWDIAVSFVHTLQPGVDIYAGYQHQELDLDATARSNLTFSGTSTSIDSVDIFVVGSRIKF